MEAIEIIELIGRGEDSHTQFKQTVTSPESVAGDLVAFSNSKGGRIVIGVNDKGAVVGLSADDVHRINQLVSNTSTNLVHPLINPTTENISVGSLLVMVVTVQEGISKPYADNNGVFWVKSGSDKRRVTSREEVQRMFQSADLIHADELPIEGTTTGDIDLEHFRRFFEKLYGEPLDKALDRDGLSLVRLLNNLGLAREATLSPLQLLDDSTPCASARSAHPRPWPTTPWCRAGPKSPAWPVKVPNQARRRRSR
jgi:ATP-dependent DNA helicase RecG